MSHRRNQHRFRHRAAPAVQPDDRRLIPKPVLAPVARRRDRLATVRGGPSLYRWTGGGGPLFQARPQPLVAQAIAQRELLALSGRCGRAPASRGRTAGRRSAARRGTSAQPSRPELARRRCSRGGRGWSPSGVWQSLRCSEPIRPGPTARSQASSDVARAPAAVRIVDARGEQVAGVQADAEALVAAGGLDQRAELLERAPERARPRRRCSPGAAGSPRTPRAPRGSPRRRARSPRRRRRSSPSPGAARRRRAPERRAGAQRRDQRGERLRRGSRGRRWRRSAGRRRGSAARRPGCRHRLAERGDLLVASRPSASRRAGSG